MEVESSTEIEVLYVVGAPQPDPVMWENLTKMGFQGPGIYALCSSANEEVAHFYFLHVHLYILDGWL